MNGITKETFLKAEGKLKDEMLYDMLQAIYKRKAWDTLLAGITGFIGGFTAIVMKWVGLL